MASGDIAVVISAVALAVTLGVLIFGGGRGEGQHEEKFHSLSRDIDRLESEIEKLRAWRHAVGNNPGYAALMKNEDVDRRVAILESALRELIARMRT